MNRSGESNVRILSAEQSRQLLDVHQQLSGALGPRAFARRCATLLGEVFATMYQRLGIDVNKVTLDDHAGRPQYLVPDGLQPMVELV